MTSRRDFISKLGMAGLAAAASPALAQTEIRIERKINISKNRAIPISLEGFTGEALSALTFDLEVQGFEVVSKDRAEFTLTGDSSGGLKGRVLDAGAANRQIIGKAYSGSATRTLVHAFSDDAIKAITSYIGEPREGIARTKVAFKVPAGRGKSELFVSDFDGHNAYQITRDNSEVAAPAWGPRGGTLAYTSYMSNDFPDIYTHDLRSGSRRVIARYKGTNTSPAISPDGTKIAMILSKGGSPDVYVSNIDGSGLTRLTTTRAEEASPCWSPDGSQICFTSAESGRAALYTVPASGGSMRRIKTAGVFGAATEPDWSPDGKSIIFTSLAGKTFTLFTVPAGGGAAEMLVPGEDASWAPNSRTVIFAKRVGYERILSLLDVPTKHVKDIKLPAGSASQPCWAR